MGIDPNMKNPPVPSFEFLVPNSPEHGGLGGEECRDEGEYVRDIACALVRATKWPVPHPPNTSSYAVR